VKLLKSFLFYFLLVLVGAIVGFVIAGVIHLTTGTMLFGGTHDNTRSNTGTRDTLSDNAELTSLAYDVLGYMIDGDYRALSNVVHPEYGVVFSPYATVSVATNKCFQADQVAAFGSDTAVYVWGVYDGSGEPIELTVEGFLTEFVAVSDYADAAVVGINRIVRSGNALENITDVFPYVRFIDFHIPGGDRDSVDDLDWRSLRLGFELHEGKLWLTAVVHSQWTV